MAGHGGPLLTGHGARTPNLFSFRRQNARARAVSLSGGGGAAGKVRSMDCGNRPLNLAPFEETPLSLVGQRRKTAVKVASPSSFLHPPWSGGDKRERVLPTGRPTDELCDIYLLTFIWVFRHVSHVVICNGQSSQWNLTTRVNLSPCIS